MSEAMESSFAHNPAPGHNPARGEADATSVKGQAQAHESAVLHVTGKAGYADDIGLPANSVWVAFGLSEVARGRIRTLDTSAVRAAPGVVAVLLPEDLPAGKHFLPTQDDPILAGPEVAFLGQPIFAVAATSQEAARRAARMAKVDYIEEPAVLDIRAALATGERILPTRTLTRGDPDTALGAAPHRLQGEIEIGGQDHFYLEGQIAIALPQENGGMRVISSTQHPTEIQHVVANALGLAFHDVIVECRRMGGGFGGKESQGAQFACMAAIVARKTGRPTRLRLDRDDDMIITGKRHDFLAQYDVGFTADGRILGLDVMLASRCGHSIDLSAPVNDRAMFHLDNAYFLENLRIVSHRCRTNTQSNTAFRGFGGPQGMVVIENIIDSIARHLGQDPLEIRRRNYYGREERNETHYGMVVEDNILEEITDALVASSDYHLRREQIHADNLNSPFRKRGLALTPIKFGISFTATQFNQAGALVQVYTDGSVLVNHGGTEMGQGLFTKVAQIVADVFALPLERIRASATDTSKVPNTSATAASAGTDLNGQAAWVAAHKIRSRLETLLCSRHNVEPHEILWGPQGIRVGETQISFPQLVKAAYEARISLSATGYYRTPKIHYDRALMQGRPFFYFAYGAAVSEVVIDTLTGEHQLLRVDILHDAGRSLNPAIDRGQIEGGFIQGAGWLTSEELYWDHRGRLRTHAPSTYKIPSVSDWPVEAHVHLLQNHPNREESIFRSKAVGEPPLMLGISVFQALRDAVAAAAGPEAASRLRAPATPEAILHALGIKHEKKGTE